MSGNWIPVPHLITAHAGPLFHVEKIILEQVALIEAWFRQQWQETPPSLTSSVDLRHAGFKLAPVDTNLFPAGFNNLNPQSLPLCIQAAQSVLTEHLMSCKGILLLPELHTRNLFYLQSVSVLRNIFLQAGFTVRLGHLDPTITQPVTLLTMGGESLVLEPLVRRDQRVGLSDFDPCLLLLNNDLSSGMPEILQNLKQPIKPTATLGWTRRLKSDHFHYFQEVAFEFARLIGLDPWLINPYFDAVSGIDFMRQEGLEDLAAHADALLLKIKAKYADYEIKEKPFLVIKADNGTYGMGVMMINDAQQLHSLNRKQRTRMATIKGNRKVDRVLLQEGVYTFETMPNGAVAEPVVYMIGQFVVGGFYRVHQEREKNENLNAPGMHFEPLAFAQACNMPQSNLTAIDFPNRFYAYGVIARLAALAAAKEIASSEKI